MKKTWLFLTMLAISATAHAQQEEIIDATGFKWLEEEVCFPRHEIDLSIGTGCIDNDFNNNDRLMFGKEYYSELSPMERYNRLKYARQEDHYQGSYALSYRYGWSKHWYTGIMAGYHPRQSALLTKANNETVKKMVRNSIVLMPSVRYYYTTRSRLRLYTEAAAGVSMDRSKRSNETQYHHRVKGAIQFTYIGMSMWMSSNSSLFCELGVGDLGFFRCGIGIKLQNDMPHTARQKYKDYDSKQPYKHGVNPRNGKPMRIF